MQRKLVNHVVVVPQMQQNVRLRVKCFLAVCTLKQVDLSVLLLLSFNRHDRVLDI